MTRYHLVPEEMTERMLAVVNTAVYPSEWRDLLAASPVFVPSDAQVDAAAIAVMPHDTNFCGTAYCDKDAIAECPAEHCDCRRMARAFFAALPQILAEEPAERAGGSGAG